mmetsp:Transcript_19635/g.45726  ORF Transcript_19635/g.45726 Transcript_19635/m.45726 type:complete len:424 (+) Transcript_19635:160-1431(+)
MPRKERPGALPESIFQGKVTQGAEVWDALNDDAPEIPVHNTFIQFGTSEEEVSKKLVTAPAWMGPSLQSIVAAAAAIPPPDEDETHTPHPEREGRPELASPKKIPVMRYAMSASSARAAGYECTHPGEVDHVSTVVASYEGVPGLPQEAVGSGSGGVSTTAADDQASKAGQEAAADKDKDDDDEEESDGDVDSDLERIRELVEKGELPSLGSKRHLEGQCKRCCFFPKGRCQNGYDCEFCHFEHEKRRRKKKKKKKTASGAAGEGTSDGEGEKPPKSAEPTEATKTNGATQGSTAPASNSSKTVTGTVDAFTVLGSPVKVPATPPVPPPGVPSTAEAAVAASAAPTTVIGAPEVVAAAASGLDPNASPFFAGGPPLPPGGPYGFYDGRYVDPAFAAAGHHLPGAWDPYMPMVAGGRPTFPPPR